MITCKIGFTCCKPETGNIRLAHLYNLCDLYACYYKVFNYRTINNKE